MYYTKKKYDTKEEVEMVNDLEGSRETRTYG
jgi:hypothetical protein